MSCALRILIVDDDTNMAKTTAAVLRIKGYGAETAYSGSEALDKMVEDSFDCLLSDIKMPGINGVELYRAIKVQRPRLPCILMTGYSSDNLVQEGLREGALAVLTKPVKIEKMLAMLAQIGTQEFPRTVC
jgi:two-component system response regulator HydG